MRRLGFGSACVRRRNDTRGASGTRDTHDSRGTQDSRGTHDPRSAHDSRGARGAHSAHGAKPRVWTLNSTISTTGTNSVLARLMQPLQAVRTRS